MPAISRFHGITIRMYFNEAIHSGRPHFHAAYGGTIASFDAETIERLAGKLPRRIERKVRRWARAHQRELIANWELARAGEQMKTVDPLR